MNGNAFDINQRNCFVNSNLQKFPTINATKNIIIINLILLPYKSKEIFAAFFFYMIGGN